MAHAVRGLLLLSVYSGGFSAVGPICHFNASVRRFNVWGYPLYRRRPACPVAVVYGLMAWRCPMLRGLPLALPACRRPCSPVALSVTVPCSGGVGLGSPAAASPCVALRESRWHSRCESRMRLRQSRLFTPKS